jgi:HEPN domain-containing protein
MANRARDWLEQAAHDLEHARHAQKDGDHDWACFAAHQAAEKALKRLFLALGGEAWGHSLTRILKDLAERLALPKGVASSARRLDKHYIPTRYPNGFDAGVPYEYYTEEDSRQAIEDARHIHDFCRQSFH